MVPPESTSDERRGSDQALRRPNSFFGRCVLGAYRVALDRPAATVGPQPERFGGSRAWLLPNPSGLNAHYQLPALVDEFGKLRRALSRRDGGR